MIYLVYMFMVILSHYLILLMTWFLQKSGQVPLEVLPKSKINQMGSFFLHF